MDQLGKATLEDDHNVFSYLLLFPAFYVSYLRLPANGIRQWTAPGGAFLFQGWEKAFRGTELLHSLSSPSSSSLSATARILRTGSVCARGRVGNQREQGAQEGALHFVSGVLGQSPWCVFVDQTTTDISNIQWYRS